MKRVGPGGAEGGRRWEQCQGPRSSSTQEDPVENWGSWGTF